MIYDCTLKIERYEECMVNWLRHVLDEEWAIKPAGGLTGNAFIAEKDNQRLFLKRNSAPFLAVLSAEGIVPKLIWTKRMENGDVITAQKWLEGRKLRPEEMRNDQVANILHKIHHSSELLHMLMRLGKQPVTTDESYNRLAKKTMENYHLYKNDEIQRSLSFLQKLLPATRKQKQVVCHCDLNHNNLILTKSDQLLLIDWDNAKIADPMIDLGMVLKWYIPEAEWDIWLDKYGIEKNKQFMERMHWYLLYHSLYYLNWHIGRNESHKVTEQIHILTDLNEYVQRVILD